MSEIADSDMQTEEAQASKPPSPPLHEPKFLCRLVRPQHFDDKSNAFRLQFFDEGAANAVFKLVPCSTPRDANCCVLEDQKGEIVKADYFARSVLRVSKGKPKTLRYKEIMEGFHNEVWPLFRKSERLQTVTKDEAMPQDESSTATKPLNLSITESFEEFIMEPHGVAVSYDVLEVLLAALRRHSPRNKHMELRHLEERAILLPDMSGHSTSVTFEIKPKWLAQSMNAPRDAFLCRTCALHAFRKSQGQRTDNYICPLALVAGNTHAIERAVRLKMEKELVHIEEIADKPESETQELVVKRAVDYLATGPGHKILQHLRYLQTQLDPKGILAHTPSADEDHRLRLAMTLRDCSLFVRVPLHDANAPIEAKLADLDFKARDKMGDWKRKENNLVNGGWYVDMKSGMDACWIAQGWKRYVPHYF